MAAAPVSAAEGGPAGGQCGGQRPPARPGALLRRLGPHTADCCSVQAALGPVLSHHRGIDVPISLKLLQLFEVGSYRRTVVMY